MHTFVPLSSPHWSESTGLLWTPQPRNLRSSSLSPWAISPLSSPPAESKRTLRLAHPAPPHLVPWGHHPFAWLCLVLPAFARTGTKCDVAFTGARWTPVTVPSLWNSGHILSSVRVPLKSLLVWGEKQAPQGTVSALQLSPSPLITHARCHAATC